MKRCSTSLIIWLTHSVVFDSLRPRGLQHARLPCPAPIPSTCSNSRSSSWWCHPTISSSVVPFSSASFLRTQFFVSGSHSGGASASASASALPMSIQDLLPLGLIDWISLQCKDSQWEFSSTTVQKHQFFCAQLLLLFFFKFYFIFKLYNIVSVLPYMEMNLPQAYTCSPSWTLVSPPSPYHPSGSSQITSPKHPVSCIEPGLATRFIWYYTYFNAILPNHLTLSLSHRVQKTVLYISVSFAVSYTGLLLSSF